MLEVRLHRPEVRNAISTPLLRELVGVLETDESDPGVGAVIQTGGDT